MPATTDPSRSKKRPSKSQGGRPPKRAHVVPSDAPKRAKPITAKAQERDTSDEENSFNDEDVEMEHSPQIGLNNPQKTGNEARESHQAQRELQAQRKANKPNAALMDQAKRTWALARAQNLPKDEREKYIKQLAAIVKGRVQEVVFKHDASRIIQTIVKHGGPEEREQIATELQGRYKELAQNKYSKFLVTKSIRYCAKQRSSILAEFHGHIMRLLLHREAGQVLADAYELYSNAHEKSLFLRDFYGKEVTLFEPKQDGKTALQQILDGADDDRRRRITAALKENLDLIFNNPDKGAVSYSIVHHAMWEYLSELNNMPAEDAEKLRREIYETSQELLAEMAHTKDGSLVVRHFLAYGTAKDRKQIVKLLKPHLERLCTDEEAQLVLFTALDVIDDTKLLAKSFLTDLANLTPKLYSDTNGRRSLLYPLIHRSQRHFTPAIISTLASTDSIKSQTSKKGDDIRKEEHRKAVSEGMLKAIERYAAEMIVDRGGSLFVGEVLLNADGDKQAAIDAVLEPLAQPYPDPNHPIELAHTSRMLKLLLQGGHFSQTTHSVERSPHWDPSNFASAFLRIVSDDDGTRIKRMAKGGGTFVIVELCEVVRVQGREEDQKVLCRIFDTKTIHGLDLDRVRGGKILGEKLNGLIRLKIYRSVHVDSET